MMHIEHTKVHVKDCRACEKSSSSKIDQFTRVIELKGDLDKSQRQRLL